MNFPLCQIFSVLVMGMCAPRCVAISEYGRGGEASIEGTYERTERKRQIGAVRAAALLLRLSVLVRLGKIAHGWRIAFGLLRFGRLLCFCGLIQRAVSGLRLHQNSAVAVFPDAEKKKRKGRSQDPELGFARNLGLGLPAEELRGKKKSQNGPTREREHLDQQLPNWKGGVNGVLKTGDQICSGQEQRNTQGGCREIWNWQRGTGHEYQG